MSLLTKAQAAPPGLFLRGAIPPYKSLACLAAALTGFASLAAQLAWQKHLSVLVGSEARSINLAVAVFLAGLAAGCYVFGKITALPAGWGRKPLMRLYGLVELATALYILAFPFYFEGVLKPLSFLAPPESLMADIAISCLTLLLPTFLMGASIPVLTAALPETPEDVSPLHVKIYGWNTFGAFLGAAAAGFFLLPLFGLSAVLGIAGALNALAALVFLSCRLKGHVQKLKSLPAFSSRLPNSLLLIFAFLAGAIAISFEILFIRLLNLSAGAGVFNFPMILSIFVGGLALGSLSIKPRKISSGFFASQIFAAVLLLGASYLAAPYLSIWISHIRVSLSSIGPVYYLFKAAVYISQILLVFPSVFFMGRLLPLIYALMKKGRREYGASCGQLFFLNTAGTAAGAIGIGYLAFYAFSLDELFKINIAVLAAMAGAAALWEKRFLQAGLALALCAAAALLPKWDRTGHHLGYFRQRAAGSGHFQGLFHLPKMYSKEKSGIIYFEDGPNVSATLIGYKDTGLSARAREIFPSEKHDYASFVVNGKAIGQTVGSDFSTMFLLSGLGYLFAPEREGGISSAVIGLGMGISAGVLARQREVSEVTVMEIAPEVIEMARREPAFNFSPMKNPKVKALAADGFKHFSRTKKKYDLIVSQTSNPWVAGVENVFSLEFYEMAKKALAEDGVLIQWAQLYSIDQDTLKIMFHTLKKVFPHARLYQIGSVDVAIAASPRPLREAFPAERFFEPGLKPYYRAMGFDGPEDIHLIEVFSESELSYLADSNKLGLHTLTFPKLAYRGDKTFFTGTNIDPMSLAPDYMPRSPGAEARKTRAFKKHSALSHGELAKKCVKEIAFLCGIIAEAARRKRIFERAENPLLARLRSYAYLRRRGLMAENDGFLRSARRQITERGIKNKSLLFLYLGQLLRPGSKGQALAESGLALLRSKGLLSEKDAGEFKKLIKKSSAEAL